MVEISGISLLIGLAINGVFTGLGVAIGTYLSEKYLIRKMESLKEKLKVNDLKKLAGKMGNYIKDESSIIR